MSGGPNSIQSRAELLSPRTVFILSISDSIDLVADVIMEAAPVEEVEKNLSVAPSGDSWEEKL